MTAIDACSTEQARLQIIARLADERDELNTHLTVAVHEAQKARYQLDLIRRIVAQIGPNHLGIEAVTAALRIALA